MFVGGPKFSTFTSLSVTTINTVLRIIPVLVLVTGAGAQQTSSAPIDSLATLPDASSARAAPGQSGITVPAGTRLALVLTQRVNSKTMHPGDTIYTQTTALVRIGDQLAIPSGAFVEGTIDKLNRHGSRGEFPLRSASLVFRTGHVAKISGPTTLHSDEGTARRNPSRGTKAAALIAPIAGLFSGMAIGAAAHSPSTRTVYGQTITTSTSNARGIGIIAGFAAGSVVAFALRARSHHFYVESGSPLEITLDQPVILSETQVTSAIKKPPSQPSTISTLESSKR